MGYYFCIISYWIGAITAIIAIFIANKVTTGHWAVSPFTEQKEEEENE